MEVESGAQSMTTNNMRTVYLSIRYKIRGEYKSQNEQVDGPNRLESPLVVKNLNGIVSLLSCCICEETATWMCNENSC